MSPSRSFSRRIVLFAANALMPVPVPSLAACSDSGRDGGPSAADSSSTDEFIDVEVQTTAYGRRLVGFGDNYGTVGDPTRRADLAGKVTVRLAGRGGALFPGPRRMVASTATARGPSWGVSASRTRLPGRRDLPHSTLRCRTCRSSRRSRSSPWSPPISPGTAGPTRSVPPPGGATSAGRRDHRCRRLRRPRRAAGRGTSTRPAEGLRGPVA